MLNPIPQLETVTAKDLLTRPIQPLGFTIDDILPHGLFILAGSPKVGKSWLALDMCSAVAAGGNLWQYSAAQGDVLYLALKDKHKRLQERHGHTVICSAVHILSGIFRLADWPVPNTEKSRGISADAVRNRGQIQPQQVGAVYRTEPRQRDAALNVRRGRGRGFPSRAVRDITVGGLPVSWLASTAKG